MWIWLMSWQKLVAKSYQVPVFKILPSHNRLQHDFSVVHFYSSLKLNTFDDAAQNFLTPWKIVGRSGKMLGVTFEFIRRLSYKKVCKFTCWRVDADAAKEKARGQLWSFGIKVQLPSAGPYKQAAAYKKNNDRSEGKSRRCCLGDSIVSFLCRASYFEPGRFED